MTKLARRLWYEGKWYNVQPAVCADGSMPWLDALRQIAGGSWPEDPEAQREGLPSDAQVSSLNRVVALVRYFADYGEPSRGGLINALQDGIWEFKEGEKRFSFFDTDGNGGYAPKVKIRNRNDAEFPDSQHWEIPTFDELLRIGHCFGKKHGQRTTSPADIAETKRIRMEDLEHDQ